MRFGGAKMNITINKNGEFIDVDEKKLVDNTLNCKESDAKDGLTSLAEGLNTATSLAQVRSSAKAVLGGACDES